MGFTGDVFSQQEGVEDGSQCVVMAAAQPPAQGLENDPSRDRPPRESAT
jgi:hypothetical protein